MQTKNAIQFRQNFNALLDDVMTTGTTLYEAAKTPHRAGRRPSSRAGLGARFIPSAAPLLCSADFSIERYDRRRVLRYDVMDFQDY